MISIAEHEREVLSEMTKTEQRIISYYLENGGSAKSIAKALGVSERTVYKALYLFRRKLRERGIDTSKLYLRSTTEARSIHPNKSELRCEGKDLEEIISKRILPIILEQVRMVLHEELRKIFAKKKMLTDKSGFKINFEKVNEESLLSALSSLNRSIQELNRNILHLVSLLDKNDFLSEDNEIGTAPTAKALPSFIRGNPWMEVLRTKNSSPSIKY
ncbi:MAG: hypothetical protein B6U94_00420 [Thermofilum sp. ex4484_79]|nr:MAG: hypothetical protein B6U94_00420 [Thermofilum sp. ex4484_79]